MTWGTPYQSDQTGLPTTLQLPMEEDFAFSAFSDDYNRPVSSVSSPRGHGQKIQAEIHKSYPQVNEIC